MLARLARLCYRRRRSVLLLWVVALVGLLVLGSSAGGKFRTDFRLPSSESRRAQTLLEAAFPQQAGGGNTFVVFKADSGINDASVQKTMTNLFTKITADAGVTVVSPYTAAGAGQVSSKGTIAFAQLELPYLTEGQKSPQVDAIRADRDAVMAASHGITIELAGQPFQDKFKPPASEGIGLLAAILILLFAFGSVLAMGLPIMVALFGIGCGFVIIKLLAHILSVPDFTTQLAAMIGLGVGIDYALFIVTRYRSSLHDGNEPEEAIVESLSTAGRAVLFAGLTVVVSLLGMFLMGLAFVRGMAVGASATVLMTMIASVTLLPAVLGFAGHNIDKLGLPHRKVKPGSHRQTFWYRWSRVVQRRPWPAFVFGLVVLLACSIPLFSIRLGSSDAGNLPKADTTRRAYDLLSSGFGPGFNGPLILAVDLSHGGGPAVLPNVVRAVESTPGVEFVFPAVTNATGDTAVIRVFPTTSPQDAATTQLIHQLRNDTIPRVTEGTGAKVLVGGVTASFNDFADYLGKRLPWFVGAVLTLSFLLLMAVFRSVLVPLKAVVMNLLSIGAAYGVVVAVFQWGWGASLIGLGKQGPIDAWAPMMLFAIVFGLSMDYEVFLLSRVREEYDRTGDNGLAVADGLAATARVITAAAAIMVCVFASFVLGDQRSIKLFGVGLSVAVFIDATIVRLVLVPATMELLGARNWWMPKWLDRILPRLNVEGSSAVTPPDDDDSEDRELVGASR
jgi:RND superfamily putative drug exporter